MNINDVLNEETTMFDKLFRMNIADKVEKRKSGTTELSYLSWAWAWATIKHYYPDAQYEIVMNERGLPYFEDERLGIMVYTKVTLDGVTHMMWLPVMDGANKAMRFESYTYTVKNPNFKYATLKEDGKYYDKYGKEQPETITKICEAATMFDVNKTVMRCLTKNLAMFGLGLSLYIGEDIPKDFADEVEKMSSLIANIQARVKLITATMDNNQKYDFGDTHIKPYIGSYDCAKCKDIDKLRELLNHLNEIG